MKISSLSVLVLLFLSNHLLIAQNNKINTNIDPENYSAFNREASFKDGTAHLNAKAGDGLLWLNNTNFKNGTIELDIKGKDAPGQSFVGIAFHGKDNETFDAVYFRPFNFKNPDRNSHSIQYVSVPQHDWSALREAYPGKYENTINPLPELVDDWFHVQIIVDAPQVKVYVNGSAKPTLAIEQISDARQGKVGFWVGNGSEGWFRNLKITHDH